MTRDHGERTHPRHVGAGEEIDSVITPSALTGLRGALA